MTSSAGIWQALKDVIDPETGIDVVDLGLIYSAAFDEAQRTASVVMTLTSRACPVGEAIREGVERRLSLLPGVAMVEVSLSFDPPWTPDRISPEGREKLQG